MNSGHTCFIPLPLDANSGKQHSPAWKSEDPMLEAEEGQYHAALYGLAC